MADDHLHFSSWSREPPHAKEHELLAQVTATGKVPEVNDEHLREVPAYSRRVLYHARNGEVFIVTLVHKRRYLIGEDLLPLK